MGIKKLDVKIQQLCSDSVRGDIKESLCGLIGAELSLQRRAQHTAQDGNVCIQSKPNLQVKGTHRPSETSQ